jgi:hypothetical protein
MDPGLAPCFGREAELAALATLLDPSGPAVVHLSGPGGIGKSFLIEVFSERARAAGATVVRLDCRAIEPSLPGFLGALSTASGGSGASIPDVVERLGSLPGPVVLVLDTYELFWLLDSFLRLELGPVLSANVRLLLAGREPPATAWLTSAVWQGRFVALSLGPLTQREALAYLRELGLEAGTARRVNAIARGHPLSLTIAAQLGASSSPEDAAFRAGPDALANEYFAAVPDALTREALQAASVVRRVTEPVLRAMIPSASPADLFDRLRRLNIVGAASDGLFVHDVVRDAIAASLEAADPERHRRYRAAAWRVLKAELAHATPATLWRYTADILYLLRNPFVREGFFPSGYQPLVVEPATAGDGEAIAEVTRRHAGSEEASALSLWWDRKPRFFRVCRDPDGRARGYLLAAPGKAVDEEIMAADPVAAAWAEDMAATGGRERSLLLRRLLDIDDGEGNSASRGPLGLDVKRTYVEMRPNLRYIYLGGNDSANFDWCDPLGFELLPAAGRQIDGRAFHSQRLDMGPGSVEGWLARLVGEELGISAEEQQGFALDADSRELSYAGHRIHLTQLETGVFELLHSRRGRAVSRADLLEHVWGYDREHVSNVVEAVILSLRRKLGPHAPALETVRGIGYRLRRD